jgi:lysophospholipid acyltransferase (LPLAT)-like uncharacterized protein
MAVALDQGKDVIIAPDGPQVLTGTRELYVA